MKKRSILLLLFAFCLLAGKAQDISVKSFELLPNDLTAIINGTMENDQNGEVAALIKVITSEKGFVFDGGMMGIVKVVQKVGEIWVYVPHGINHISISHQQLGKLRDYYFPVSIEKARTYEMVLTTAKIKTSIEEDAGGGYVAFDISPSEATVIIGDMKLKTNEDGTLSVFLSYGPYDYRIEADGYKPATGHVEVSSEETQPIEITLRSVMATVTLTTDMAEAEIWANNRMLGKGSWTGGLPAGSYAIETRRDGYRPRPITASFVEKEERTIALESPIPVYGRLRADSKPSGAEVIIDGEVLGKTPGIFDNVLFGNRQPMFRKEGYADTTAVVTIEEGKIAVVSVEMRKAEKKDLFEQGANGTGPYPYSPKKYYSTKGFYVSPLLGFGGDIDDDFIWGGNVGFHVNGFDFQLSYMAKGEHRDVSDDLDGSYAFHNRFDFNIGYETIFEERFCFTPFIGIGLLSIESLYSHFDGKSLYIREKTFSAYLANVSLRMEYALSPHIHIYATPIYDLPLGVNYKYSGLPTSNEVKKHFSKIAKGFNFLFGLSYHFYLQK